VSAELLGPIAAQRHKEAREVFCDGASGDAALERIIFGVFAECFMLWKERQRKYGRGNIAAFGEIGCLVRGSDKLARLRQALIANKGAEATDESIEDSWRDLLNYAAMGLTCRRGQWPS
jgi:hypothetical protein